jgi:hypothetical protein
MVAKRTSQERIVYPAEATKGVTVSYCSWCIITSTIEAATLRANIEDRSIQNLWAAQHSSTELSFTTLIAISSSKVVRSSRLCPR